MEPRSPEEPPSRRIDPTPEDMGQMIKVSLALEDVRQSDPSLLIHENKITAQGREMSSALFDNLSQAYNSDFSSMRTYLFNELDRQKEAFELGKITSDQLAGYKKIISSVHGKIMHTSVMAMQSQQEGNISYQDALKTAAAQRKEYESYEGYLNDASELYTKSQEVIASEKESIKTRLSNRLRKLVPNVTFSMEPALRLSRALLIGASILGPQHGPVFAQSFSQEQLTPPPIVQQITDRPAAGISIPEHEQAPAAPVIETQEASTLPSYEVIDSGNVTKYVSNEDTLDNILENRFGQKFYTSEEVTNQALADSVALTDHQRDLIRAKYICAVDPYRTIPEFRSRLDTLVAELKNNGATNEEIIDAVKNDDNLTQLARKLIGRSFFIRPLGGTGEPTEILAVDNWEQEMVVVAHGLVTPSTPTQEAASNLGDSFVAEMPNHTIEELFGVTYNESARRYIDESGNSVRAPRAELLSQIVTGSKLPNAD
jgi:hypothetical protein